MKEIVTLKDLEWLKNTPIAHRGLHNKRCPENSLFAFENAIEKGYAIELDVQVLADKTVVVFHDENLLRMTGIDGVMQTLKYDEIKPYFLNNTNQKIPTLKEVLEYVDGRVPLLIEIKQNAKRRGVREVLEVLKNYHGKYAIQSFDPFILATVRRLNSGIARGQLSSSFKGEKMSKWKSRLLSRLRLNVFSKPHFISYNYKDLPNRYVNKTGLPVLAWTVKAQGDYDEIKEVCDNIIFEGFIPF